MLQNAMPAFILLAVMVVIAIALQRFRRQLPGLGIGLGSRQGPALKVLSALNLGPQQRVVTVQVGEGASSAWLVLGVTPGGITLLQEVPADDVAPEANSAKPDVMADTVRGTEGASQIHSRFAQRLAQLTRKNGYAPQ